MSITSASAVLAGVWVVSFIVALSVPFLLYLKHTIEGDELSKGLNRLSNMYSPYIGAILAYFFVSRSIRARQRVTSNATAAVALSVSAVWNVVLVVIIIQTMFGSRPLNGSLEAPLNGSLDLAAEVSAKLSWLVAPVMGYFFGKEDPVRS